MSKVIGIDLGTTKKEKLVDFLVKKIGKDSMLIKTENPFRTMEAVSTSVSNLPVPTHAAGRLASTEDRWHDGISSFLFLLLKMLPESLDGPKINALNKILIILI